MPFGRSARRIGANLGNWFRPNGEPNVGEYSHDKSVDRNQRHNFGGGKWFCHTPLLAAVERRL